MAIERRSRLVTKVLKSFGSTDVSRAALRKHAYHDQFFCGLDDHVLCHPNQKILQFIPGSNEKFTVELYKKELGKPYLKIDLFFCNVTNVDDAVDRKAVEEKNVGIERSCIVTSPIFRFLDWKHNL